MKPFRPCFSRSRWLSRRPPAAELSVSPASEYVLQPIRTSAEFTLSRARHEVDQRRTLRGVRAARAILCGIARRLQIIASTRVRSHREQRLGGGSMNGLPLLHAVFAAAA